MQKNSNPPKKKLQLLIGLLSRKQFKKAVLETNKLLKKFPSSALLYNIVGAANAGLEQFDRAVGNYRRAIKINPHYAEAYYNMASALKNKGDLINAIDGYKQAIKIKPNYPRAHNNMGIALKASGDIEGAIKSFKQAIKYNPSYAEAYYGMGDALKTNDDMISAIHSYKQALRVKPDFEQANLQKLYQQRNICDWSEFSDAEATLSKLGTMKQFVSPFAVLALEDSPERHQKRSERFAKTQHKNVPFAQVKGSKIKPNRLRIGYFSADFHDHATMYLMAKVFESHDTDRFEIYAYSLGPNKTDKMRQRLRDAVDVFVDVQMMTDKSIAELARQNNIDIAVDLKGYTENARPGIFAFRAAPIQINYLGYPGTMGADFIDYLIADKIVIPPKLDRYYSENIIYLPHSYQANDDSRKISDEPLNRLDMGLPEKGFVFCCFNNNYKISPDEFQIWMRVLRKVDGSVLWLFKSNNWAEANLQAEAEKKGISRDRIIFADRMPHADHLARHRLADLFLDTFNYNAHTTASDALWAGLPLVTKMGQGFAARVAASLLEAMDLSELITTTQEEYEELILNLATNPKRLLEIKETLKNNIHSTHLFDTRQFTKGLEDGYQKAYQRYFDGNFLTNIFVK